MWWVYALLSALFAALTAIFAKIGVENVNSNLATAVRTVVILIMIWLIVLFRNELKISDLSNRNWTFLIISGMATGLSWIFYFKALQMGDVSKVVGIDKLSLALTVVVAVIFLGEALTWKTAVGAGLIIAGTFLLILK